MFRKLIRATVAATLVATPMVASVAEAQAQMHKTTTVHETAKGRTVVRTVNHKANGNTVIHKTTAAVPARVSYRRFAKGQRFDRRYAPNYAVVDYRRYRARRLYAPPRGYHWVRAGNDAVLVGITTGLVAATLAGALR